MDSADNLLHQFGITECLIQYHGLREIRLHRTLDEEQIVVFEIAECTEMEIQQNRHDFTVGQRCCTPSTLHSAIVFQQISCIFCIKMFAKLVYYIYKIIL